MHVQRRSDEQQQRRFWRQFLARKISEAPEFAPRMMPRNARPVIQPLQRQMNIFIRLQFNYGQPFLASGYQHVDHGAIGG